MHQNETNITYTAIDLFNMTPHNWQHRAGNTIIHNTANNETIRLLIIQPTGAGIKLLYQTVATHLKGVTLYLSPLLSLSINQVHKFMSRNRFVNTNIVSVYLDEVRHKKELKSFISLVKNTTAPTTVLIFEYTQESFQLQMGFSFTFLRANYLRSSLLIMRTRSFLLSFT